MTEQLHFPCLKKKRSLWLLSKEWTREDKSPAQYRDLWGRDCSVQGSWTPGSEMERSEKIHLGDRAEKDLMEKNGSCGGEKAKVWGVVREGAPNTSQVIH